MTDLQAHKRWEEVGEHDLRPRWQAGWYNPLLQPEETIDFQKWNSCFRWFDKWNSDHITLEDVKVFIADSATSWY